MSEPLLIWQYAGYVIFFGFYLGGTAYLAARSTKPKTVWAAGIALNGLWLLWMICAHYGLDLQPDLVWCLLLPILWARYVKPSGFATLTSSRVAPCGEVDGSR